MFRRALLVGINDYRTMTPLKAPLNDLLQLEAYLVAERGMALRDVTLLTDHDATRERVLAALSAMISSGEGEELLFYFTGHGVQVPDAGGEEVDGFDEALVTYSEKTTELILDDELHALLREVPEDAVLYVVLDTCHSGSDEVLTHPDRKGRQRDNCVVIASALPDQSSWQMGSAMSIRRHGYEWWEDGRFHSTFTFYMLRLLRMFPEGLSCTRLIEKINLYLRIHDYEQRCTAVGSAALLERPFLRSLSQSLQLR